MEIAEQELEEKMRNFVNMRLRDRRRQKARLPRRYFRQRRRRGQARGLHGVEDQGRRGDEDLQDLQKIFQARIENLKVSAWRWRKWQSEVYAREHAAGRADQAPAIRGGARRAKDMRINEKLYEDIVMAQTAAAFDALSDDKKMLLKRILGQMLTHMKRVVIKEWKYKVDNADRQRR